MTNVSARRYVLLSSFAGVILLQKPFAIIAEKLTGDVSGIPVLIGLVAWRIVAAVVSGSVADHHTGLVLGIAVVLYAACYGIAAILAHFALRDQRRLHDLAIAVLALGFVALMTHGLPIGGLPL